MANSRAVCTADALRRGVRDVVMPANALLFGLAGLPIVYLSFKVSFDVERDLTMLLAGLIGGIACSCACRSIMAPRWRRWAYQRTLDIQKLEALAVEAKIVRSLDHPLRCLEWRMSELGRELAEFENRIRRMVR